MQGFHKGGCTSTLACMWQDCKKWGKKFFTPLKVISKICSPYIKLASKYGSPPTNNVGPNYQSMFHNIITLSMQPPSNTQLIICPPLAGVLKIISPPPLNLGQKMVRPLPCATCLLGHQCSLPNDPLQFSPPKKNKMAAKN